VVGEHQRQLEQTSIEDLMPLLRSMALAIDDIRGQLAAKRKEFFTVEETANLVGRAAYTVRTWISEKQITAIRVQGTGPKGRLLIPRAEIERLVCSGRAGNLSVAALD
jgi:excisionase family DNA binding protein